MNDRPQPISRRGILAAAAAGSAMALIGSGTSNADPGEYHAAPDGPTTSPADGPTTLALVTKSTIYGYPTYYEDTGAATSFRYEPAFHSRLETWFVRFILRSPNNWVNPQRIYSYGAYVNKTGMHGQGRAFDLTRIRVTDENTGSLFDAFNGRYDQWQNYTGDALTTVRKRYWGTLATLHYSFRHVISHLDNSEHHNHVHIDNAVSGSGDSSYSTSSSTQTLYVQAACRYIWGYQTAIDGQWGPQTQRDSSAALARAGSDGVITTQSRWLAFNTATASMGLGSANY